MISFDEYARPTLVIVFIIDSVMNNSYKLGLIGFACLYGSWQFVIWIAKAYSILLYCESISFIK